MRYLIIAILFASCVKSSQKENIKREPTKCTFDVSAIQRARPSFKFNVSVTGSTVRLFWKKQKNQVYTVTRNGQFVYSCTCGEYYDLNVLTGTYVYTINGYSVTVLVQGAQPSPQNNVILLDFDGHLVTGSSWNYSGDIYMAPSGLSQSQIDYIITDTRTKFAQFPVTVTTDESLYNATTRRQRLVYTTYYQWFGAVGGTSFLGTFGELQEQPCFAFTELLGFSEEASAFAGEHELGHTLDLYHVVDYCEQEYGSSCNIMAANYQCPNTERSFETYVLSKYGLNDCRYVNQVAIINNKLR